MDISIVNDQTLNFTKHALIRSSSNHNHTAGAFQIYGMIFPVDAVAPPPVRLTSLRTSAVRTTIRRKRRTKKRSSSGGEDGGGFLGDDGYGPFGGGGGDGGWNFGGHDWDEESGSCSDFMHEVICWIALSNCVHFAFKKLLRILAAYAIVEDSREKVVPIMRMTSIC